MVLSKGLRYIPKPKSLHKNDLSQTINKFSRKIELTYFFAKKQCSKNSNRFKIPSGWQPNSDTIDPEITDLLTQLKTNLNKIYTKNKQNKTHQQEINTLENLFLDKNIIIKPADKGASIVIQNSKNYAEEAKRQLSNQLHYKKLSNPIHHLIQEDINSILSRLQQGGVITKKELEFFQIQENSRPRLFYLLPKIHKNYNSWIHGNPPGRPIVSDCASDTYELSTLIDHYLAPLAITHKSYVKDTPDFIEKLQKHKVNQNCYLITLDVESLYTNIDNNSGLNAVKERMAKYSNPLRPDEDILQLLKLSLENNDFQFNNEWFLQTFGTSMGKKWAPNYANIFMAQFEEQAMSKCSKTPNLYLRFLDDIFILWPHTMEDFDKFLTTLNNHQPTIKLKPTVSQYSVDFLDVTIFKGHTFQTSNVLDTKVYFKPTDTHELLHKLSYHPKHTFTGIIKSQILRFKRICSNQSDFNNACQTLFKALGKRNYSQRFLRKIKQDTLNLLDNNMPNKMGCYPCKQSRCSLCPDKLKQTTYIETKQHKIVQISQKLTCNSSNLVYAIQCNNCRQIYVGQTKNSLATRIVQHFSDIKHKKNKTLANHFHLQLTRLRKPCPNSFQVYPLERVQPINDEQLNMVNLLAKESEWIHKLQSMQPLGINNTKDAPPPLPLILKFSDHTNIIAKEFKQTYVALQKHHPKIFRAKLITAHMRNKNLKDIVIKTNTNTST